MGGVATLGLSLLILGVLFLRRDQGVGAGPILLGFAILALAPATSALILPNMSSPWLGMTSGDADIDWQVFDEGKISAWVTDGKTVFVDVTAAWCVNCQFNKAVALDPPSVLAAFSAQNIVAMQADWTNHDPAIGAYLAQYGRAGIPFKWYSPAYPEGEILPTALSKDIVLKALDR